MEKILLAQFIAHIIADFFAQPACVSEKKQTRCLRSWHIYIHTLIVFAAAVAMMPVCGFVLWAGAIAVLHFGIDAGKCAVEKSIKKKKNIPGDEHYSNPILFFADQILHLAVIFGAVLIYMKTGGTVPGYFDLFTVRDLLAVSGFLLCLKPANVLIRICLSSLKTNKTIAESLDDESLQKAGRWIGSIERAMAFVLVVLGQFTAIGFIIAAKSVLRYNKTNEAEYVLVGTLMSFAIAFALGVGITSNFFESVINIISQ